MKQRISKYSLITLLTASILGGCSKSFLELEPRGTQLEANFYKNQTEIYQGLVAIYDVMQWGNSGGYTMKMPLLTVASDEAHAGGSDASDQPSWVAYDNFPMLDPYRGPQLGLWQKNYSGVYRANLFISKAESATGLDANFLSRTVAEAKALRAYFYFDLVRFFKNIPLIVGPIPTSELYSLTQADPADVFAQIEKDLTEAIVDLPLTIPVSENGRISKGGAKALLAKVIMFQNQDARMGQAAQLLNEVNGSGVYSLLSNYGDIHNPANRFSSESIWEIPHSSLSAWGDWGWINGGEGNVGPQFIGMADYSGPTYSAGWGFAPISLDLVNAMNGDPRFEYTIIDGQALKSGGANYNERYQNTDYFIKKYAPMQAFRSPVGTAELNWPYNEIEIRLADTYLLEAEALLRSGGDAARAGLLLNGGPGFEGVRSRVGLPPVAVTLANVYNERRLELATEGHRFFDLVRTGQAPTALASKGFTAGTHEVLPIPQQEIDVTKNSLKQNPNY
ncbi:MAG: RagB/SusD family nutrient uptake outer membrane protein [Chitinophagaceae bacterium]|nr:RagB/SusD family nutrient uptake outer membrane protein [Chitinophagaceae bacterium]